MRLKSIEIVNNLISEIQYAFYVPKVKKILFDHLPKCGGTSLRIYLRMQYPQRKIFSINGNDPNSSVLKFQSLKKNIRYGFDLIEGHRANELKEYVDPRCLKITMFREPVDRIVSHYFYVKRNPKHYLYSKVTESKMLLEEYVTSGLSHELRNWYTSHFSSMTPEDIERYPDDALAKALEVILNQYDIVGFLDNYSSFIEQVRREAHFRYKPVEEKFNVSSGRPSINEIPVSTIKKIVELNHLDVDLYKRLRKAKGL